jgi:hypothetical protein
MMTHKAVAIAVATLGMMVAGSTSAWAAQKRVKGTIVTVPPGGYVYCTVKVTNTQPIDLTVTLLDQNDNDVPTEFGYSFVASPGDTDEFYHAEAAAGAFNNSGVDVSRSCKALAQSRFLRGTPDIVVEAHDATGAVVTAQ